MQHLVPYGGRCPIPQFDVQADWSDPLAPPSILLDYVYGVAVFKRWGARNTELQQTLTERHEHFFQHIAPLQDTPPSSPSEDEPSSESGTDTDYVPQGAGYGHHMSRESGLSRAMDDVLLLSMLIKGHSPETFTAMQKRQEEEAEMRSRQVGQEKVERWLEASEPLPLLDGLIMVD
jgi:hypothetical protein